MTGPNDADREAVYNLIEKADAGAQLFYALYHLPKRQITELLDAASPGFLRAYMRAERAFMGGRR